MRRPGGDGDAAGEALIAIQDRAARDVNLILFGLWLGVRQGHRLTAEELAGAEAAIAPIAGAVVAPLRRLRRQLRPTVDPDLVALRRLIVALEIGAERRVQYREAAHSSGMS